MTYKLKVLRTEDNSNYEQELTKWRDEQRSYRMGSVPEPIPLIVTNALEVDLTPEQFEAVKKSVIEHFK